MSLRPDQLADGQVIYALTIDWLGRLWRWSSEPADVTSDPPSLSSTTIRLDGGLDQVEVTRALDTLTTEPDARRAPLSLVWPIDVAARIAEGHDLAGARGELAALCPGMTWEARDVLIDGLISEPEVGGDGEPMTCTLANETEEPALLTPSPTRAVTNETWPSAAQGDVGRPYPIPFGQAGEFRSANGTLRRLGGTPALVVYYSAINMAQTLLVASETGVASTARIGYADPTAPAGWSVTSALSVTTTTDGLGQRCSVVDISGEAASVRGSGSFWAVWPEGSRTLSSPFRPSTTIESAGELLAWAALRSGRKVDIQAFRAVGERFPWPVAGYIDDVVSLWDWATEAILPILPVSIASGPSGLYPVLWRHDATRDDALLTIRAGDGYARQGPVRYVRKPSEVANEIRLRWALDGFGDYRMETLATAAYQPSYTTSGTELRLITQGTTYSALRSRWQYRATRGLVLESGIIYSAATAWRVAAWKMRQLALVSRQVDIEAGRECYRLEPGDVVIYVDDELGLDVVALVASVTWTDRPTGLVRLEILDPSLTSVPTAGQTTNDTPNYGPGQ